MYNDPIPYRHKPNIIKKINVPLYSIWITKDGKKNKISYFESRQFYCNYYERATLLNPDFIGLKTLINSGYNLQIVGYDAYPISKSIEEHYLDISKPFGHELVLYTMLTCEPEDYVWRKYKTYDF
jgi:hypothetical protein